ncbi:hypothetical protein F5B22DRAFT_165874 [Xylaria bambusicola]|uniref:uncharacterized protein n=1 Tax=Xylaria bambusicola TaxID=326684 RepID=UPI002008B0A5|nr:uncharacterized protein F5B22DRAFT_165874 [Xylaria bambusicola]KAI0526565.1 hypothetical protein F5B22DRAFT_165874 [Xylaria bambusicola]
MSGGWKDVMKNGWHPEKSGSSLKGQVKGLVGRGDTSSSDRETRVATPRSSLRDPSSFGPPPKRVAGTTQSSSSYASAPTAAVPVGSQVSGITQQPSQAQYVEEEGPPEPKSYQRDTTGLATSHLPPPPMHYSVAGARSPQQQSTSSTATKQPTAAAKPKVPPSLPPRLPPRSGNSTPSPTLAGGQAESQGYLNQGAVNRLGAAGISVPGFGIGGAGGTPPQPSSQTHILGHSQTTDELQARFARLGTSSSVQDSASRTAEAGTRQQSIGQVASVLGKKKPPPPPPKPKKPGQSGTTESADMPPPIPLATRPKFD